MLSESENENCINLVILTNTLVDDIAYRQIEKVQKKNLRKYILISLFLMQHYNVNIFKRLNHKIL